MGDKNFVKEITNIDEDFAQWYTDIVLKAELADYADTKGCIAIKPYGYAIWENIQNYTDRKFKETGVTPKTTHPPSELRKAHALFIPSFNSPVLFFNSNIRLSSSNINFFISSIVMIITYF